MLAKQIKRRAAIKKAAEEKTKSLNQSKSLDPVYKNQIRENAYIGKKGYTIPREYLSQTDIDYLHEALFVKADTFGPKYGAPTDNVSFPVYRENAKKIYKQIETNRSACSAYLFLQRKVIVKNIPARVVFLCMFRWLICIF